MAGLNHNSKRQKLSQKYTISKKAQAHKRKLNKGAKASKLIKKSKKKGTFKEPLIPKASPFKQEILSDVYAKKEMFERQRKIKLELKKERKKLKNLERLDQAPENDQDTPILSENNQLEMLVHKALAMQNKFDSRLYSVNEISSHTEKPQKKHYFNQLYKLIESADVLIEVLDARDPSNCRSTSIERIIIGMQKKLILLLNKIDLVPHSAVEKWLKYLRREHPTLAFKSALSSAGNYRNVPLDPLCAPDELKASSSYVIGSASLINLLKNYSRAGTSKLSITVGILGYPNVGKSSVINSLKRSPNVVKVGGEAGVTKNLQYIHLDSKITLIDSPGVLFDGSVDDPNLVLRNSIKLSTVKDPEGVVESLVRRTSSLTLAKFFKVPPFQDPQEFIASVAQSRGRLTKGGLPDITATARLILTDWTSGKIRYYCLPPEIPRDEDENLSFVDSLGMQFNIDAIYNEEHEALKNQLSEEGEYVPMNGLFYSNESNKLNLENSMPHEEADKYLHFDENALASKVSPSTQVLNSRDYIKRKHRRALYNHLLENDHIGSARDVFARETKRSYIMENPVMTPFEIAQGLLVENLEEYQTPNSFGLISTNYSDDESIEDENT